MKKKIRNLTNFKLSIPIVLLVIFLAQGIALAALQPKDEVTRVDFIEMLAKNHPENSLLPANHQKLSKQGLFSQVAKSLMDRGINVLDNKSSDELMSQQEFVRITYAFAGGPKNKSLFDQKLFLKDVGIISSTDIGLTTGVDGKVFQTHKGQSEKFQTELAAPIFMNDKFETDNSSRALFTFDDQSTLTMSEDTVININKHIYNPDKNIRETLVEASLGWVRFKVTKKLANGSSFKVVTPTATAGVRGTEFVVKGEPGGNTTFLVLEGQIETRPILPNGKEGKVVFVSAGESQEISQNGVANSAKEAPPGLLKATINKTTKPKNIVLAKGIANGLAKSAANGLSKIIAKSVGQGNGNGAGNANGLGNGIGNGNGNGVGLGNGNSVANFKGNGVGLNATKFSAVSAAKNSAVGAAKNSAVSAAKNSAVSAAKNSAVAAAKSSAVAAAKSSAAEAAKQVAKEQGNNGKGKGNG